MQITATRKLRKQQIALFLLVPILLFCSFANAQNQINESDAACKDQYLADLANCYAKREQCYAEVFDSRGHVGGNAEHCERLYAQCTAAAELALLRCLPWVVMRVNREPLPMPPFDR